MPTRSEGSRSGGELDPLKFQIHGGGQGGRSQGFSQAWNPFDQDMSFTQKSHDQRIKQPVMANNNVTDGLAQAIEMRRQFSDSSFVLLKSLPGQLVWQ